MALPTEEQERITSIMLEKLGTFRPCVVCGTNQWELADGYVTLSLSDDPRTVELGGRVIPLLAVLCRNCGNTLLLNSIMMGVTPRPTNGAGTADGD